MGIRGGQIQDGTVESVDIKDDSLTFDDMNSSFTWKEPVATFTSLPVSGNISGDIRMVLDIGEMYAWINSAWKISQSVSGAYTSDDFNTDLATKTTNDLSEGTNKYFISHDNTYHTEAYITSSNVTFNTLQVNGDVGTGSSQLAIGSHTHNYVSTSGGAISGNLIPDVDSTRDLGTDTNRWANIFCDELYSNAGTIHLGTVGDNKTISVTNGNIEFSSNITLPSNGSIDTDIINITSIDPSDTATIFGSNLTGDSTLHIRIGNGSNDKLQFESWNGSSSTSLMEINQDTITIAGDLVISGTTTTVNSTNTEVSDSSFVIHHSPVGIDGDASIDVRRAKITTEGDNDAQLKWNDASNEWEVGIKGSTNPIFTSSSTKVAARFYTGTTSPDAIDRLNYNGYFYATRVYNAVYNDFADFQYLNDDLKYGKVYYHDSIGMKICNKRCQKSVTGIASDTQGMAVGFNDKEKQVPLAVSGWVLAYVDKEYSSGTALVNDKDGNLTKARIFEKILFPERIIAIFQSKYYDDKWHDIDVDGRSWVKIS